MLGLALSPVLGGTLTDLVGFRTALVICALVSSLGVAVALLFLPETRPVNAESRRSAHSWRLRKWLQDLPRATREVDREVLRARYAYFLVYFVNSGILMSTLSLYVQDRWGTGIPLGGQVLGVATAAGVMLAIRPIAAMVAGPLAGVLSDRLQGSGWRGLGSRGRWPVIGLGLLMGIIGFLLLGMRPDLGLSVLGIALVAAGAGASIACIAALSGDLAQRARPGAAMGSMAAAGDIGSAAGPLVAYALLPRMGLSYLYLLCAVVMVSGLLLCARGHGEPSFPRNPRRWDEQDQAAH
jgi:MFS family permease